MNHEQTIINKVLPHNVEAEAYLLASLLIDPNSFEKLLDLSAKIVGRDFYDRRHQHLYDIIEKLQSKSIPLDLVTLTDELRNNGVLDKVGGVEYLSHLVDMLPTSANIEYYATIIKNKSMLRTLINLCNETIVSSMEGAVEVEKLIDETEKKVFDINEEKHAASLSTIKNDLHGILQEIQQAQNSNGDMSGVPSGYYKLDEMTSGFQKSEMIIIAARPSVGKTAFALNMLSKIAKKDKVKVGFFSCEMAKSSLVKRMLSSGASVDALRMRRNMLSNDDLLKLTHEAERLYETTIVFEDTPNIPILELRGKARRMVKDYGVQILFIDYLQLITVEDSMKRNPRHEQIGYVSRSLKALARQLDIPVVALAQLNRDIESRGDDSRPKMSDLKDSGSIEQDADVIMFLHRPRANDIYNDDVNDANMTEPRELVVGKNRNGPTGIVQMVFKKNYTRFELLKKEAM